MACIDYVFHSMSGWLVFNGTVSTIKLYRAMSNQDISLLCTGN